MRLRLYLSNYLEIAITRLAIVTRNEPTEIQKDVDFKLFSLIED